jgi:hypothetical protein
MLLCSLLGSSEVIMIIIKLKDGILFRFLEGVRDSRTAPKQKKV